MLPRLMPRTRAREVALQLLFQKDQNPQVIARKAIERFVRERLLDQREACAFCLTIYDGVLANQPSIDETIVKTAENWRLSRMLPVDRNLLRIGVYEMRHATSPTPAPVIINEVIELSRRFGSADSPSFVNGILDKVRKVAETPIEKPAPAATPEE